jgi:hypothetical protein
LVAADHQKLAIRQEDSKGRASGSYFVRHASFDGRLVDNSAIAQRTRNRILGHVTDVPGGYGRKGTINANQMAAISAMNLNSSNR